MTVVKGKTQVIVRIDPLLKMRLTKLAFERSWKANKRYSENRLVEEAIREYLDTAERKKTRTRTIRAVQG